MANLILASKREVKSGSQMWHVYRLSENTKSDEFFFAQPIKALRYAFLLRKRSGAILPKSIYTKLMADVEASKAQAEPSAAQESAPQAEQASEPSALAKAFEQMKSKHPDAVLLFRMGDFYGSFGEDAKVLSEVLGITLTRTSAKDITAQQAAFPAASLDRTHQRCPSSSFICSHEHHSHNYADFSRLYPVYAPFGSVSLRPLCYYPQPLNQQR